MKNTVVLYEVEERRWLRCSEPVSVITAYDPDEVVAKLALVERCVEQEGLFAAGFIGYEASPAFDGCLAVRKKSDFPLLWFGLYEAPEEITLPAADGHDPGGGLNWSYSVTREAYNAAIESVKAHIARGDTYQVNYTLRLNTPFSGDPWTFFLFLMQNHVKEYAAFIDLEDHAICSTSPELFFRLDGRKLTSKPMKGTAARGRTPEEDLRQVEWLYNSVKNRAENVMIVDMIRNDMGRIAETGTVAVSKLFAVERYPTVLQMTTTVTSETSASFCDIMGALFPCSSITGAPKPRTMEIIAGLETTARNLYTGSIGYLAPGRRAQFNVAIRTVVVDKAKETAEYGVGGGIVWDSDTSEEYRECAIKAEVLTSERPRFEILESLLWEPSEGYLLAKEHLDRMAASAEYFDYRLDRERMLADLMALAGTLSAHPHKVRLLLERSGAFSCEEQVLQGAAPSQPVRLSLAKAPVDSKSPFLYHKTTHRKCYEDAKAACPGSDDVILFNERGEITESTIANIVVTVDGQRLTPPADCGLLPGVFRAHLLERGEIREETIHRDTLERCDAIQLINSVRRWRTAVLG